MRSSYLNMNWSVWYLKLCTCVWLRLTSAFKSCFSSTRMLIVRAHSSWQMWLIGINLNSNTCCFWSVWDYFIHISWRDRLSFGHASSKSPMTVWHQLTSHQQVWTSWSSLTVGDATAAQFISRNGLVRAAEAREVRDKNCTIRRWAQACSL